MSVLQFWLEHKLAGVKDWLASQELRADKTSVPGCWVIPTRGRAKCCRVLCENLACTQTIKYNGKVIKGHVKTFVYGFIRKAVKLYKEDGIMKVAELFNTRNKNNRQLQWSHFCRCEGIWSCVRPDHFDMETEGQNLARKPHQCGRQVCDCAEKGYPPCLVNNPPPPAPPISKPIYNGDELVGWEPISQK